MAVHKLAWTSGSKDEAHSPYNQVSLKIPKPEGDNSSSESVLSIKQDLLTSSSEDKKAKSEHPTGSNPEQQRSPTAVAVKDTKTSSLSIALGVYALVECAILIASVAGGLDAEASVSPPAHIVFAALLLVLAFAAFTLERQCFSRCHVSPSNGKALTGALTVTLAVLGIWSYSKVSTAADVAMISAGIAALSGSRLTSCTSLVVSLTAVIVRGIVDEGRASALIVPVLHVALMHLLSFLLIRAGANERSGSSDEQDDPSCDDSVFSKDSIFTVNKRTIHSSFHISNFEKRCGPPDGAIGDASSVCDNESEERSQSPSRSSVSSSRLSLSGPDSVVASGRHLSHGFIGHTARQSGSLSSVTSWDSGISYISVSHDAVAPQSPLYVSGSNSAADNSSRKSCGSLSLADGLRAPGTTNTLRKRRSRFRERQRSVRRSVDQTFQMPRGLPKISNEFPDHTTLRKIVRLFSQVSEVMDSFKAQQLISDGICDLLRCDRASVFLVDDKKKQMWTMDANGYEIRVPMERSLAGYSALHNEVLDIPDAYSDPRFAKDVDRNTGYKTSNLIVLPIGRGRSKEVVAVFEAINKRNGAFSKDDQSILAVLGKQAGMHLTHSQMYSRLLDESLKTKVFLELLEELSDVRLDMGQMMSRIMSKARLVLTVERASIFMIDHAKSELWSIVIDSEMAEKLGRDNVIRFPVGVGLAGHVAKTGALLNVPDAQACELFNNAFDKRTGFVTKTSLCVPIRSSQKVLGVIQFINTLSGKPFTAHEEVLATSFSSFVGISINNHVLYKEQMEGKIVREQNKVLKQLQIAAQQAAHAKSDFLMAMSHEIRTPMSGVIGMAELLQATPLTAEQKELTRTIQSCADALMTVINDVLDLGRIEAGKLSLEQREFDVASTFEDAVDVMRPKCSEKGISLIIDISPDTMKTLVGDSHRLRQVVINFLGNAVKFTSWGGSVIVKVYPASNCGKPQGKVDIAQEALEKDEPPPSSEEAQEIVVEVIDTGIGITANKIKNLFKPFEQEDTGTTRQYGGSGLGLSICKKLVSLMLGDIGVLSVKGEGSTFWFSCPLRLTSQQRLTIADSLHAALGNVSIKVALALTSCRTKCVLRRLCEAMHLQVVAVDTPVEIIPLFEDKTSEYLLFADPDFLMSPESPRQPTEPASWLGLHNKKVCILAPINCNPLRGLFPLSIAQPFRVNVVMNVIKEAEARSSSTSSGTRKYAAGVTAKVSFHGKLLVAEDNITNQLLIKKQLKSFGIIPTLCSNGQEAVNLLKIDRHDLVFMDCHMPLLDGYNATREIRQLEASGVLWPGLPPIVITALTADALPDTRNRCLEAGMDNYLSKPLKIDVLAAVLQEFCDRCVVIERGMLLGC
ncbi:Hybrid signal transduction histidine kinase J [Diplonema papillatum]|nr:Hybrid signal transduction histidine kinase J [Diplonema papillatum]